MFNLIFVVVMLVFYRVDAGIIDAGISLADCNTGFRLNNELPVQFLEYNSTTFNELDDVNIVLAAINKRAFPTQRDDLGQIIVKPGLEELVGVVNLHKHFDLVSGERMVFADEGEDEIICHGKPVDDLPKDTDYVPYIFKLVPNGESQQFAPLQFFCDKRKGDLFPLHSAMISGQFDSFLNDISSILTQNGVYNAIGLYYRYDKHLNVNFIENNQFLIERTYDDRQQTFEISNKTGLNAMPSQYMFDDVKCEEVAGVMGRSDSCINPRKNGCLSLCVYINRMHVGKHW